MSGSFDFCPGLLRRDDVFRAIASGAKQLFSFVIPTKAGIHLSFMITLGEELSLWIPIFTGMTKGERMTMWKNRENKVVEMMRIFEFHNIVNDIIRLIQI